MNSKPILRVKNLSKTFPNGKKALIDVNLDIFSGDFLIISGSNGSGKSVLMKHFNGLLKPTRGEVLLDGSSIEKDIRKTRAQIGFVFQDADSQIVAQTVYDDTAFGPQNMELSSGEVKERTERALDQMHLLTLKNQRPHLLSGGEKRRLAAAGVLAMESRIIVFDEPFSNLDFRGVQNLLHVLINLHQGGKTIIVITHDLEKVLAHASRLVVLKEGSIILDTLPQEALSRLQECDIRCPPGRTLSEMTWLE